MSAAVDVPSPLHCTCGIADPAFDTSHVVQAKDEEAIISRERAQHLRLLASSSAVVSEASQLAAAAEQCSARADQAAQMALLARAEAARLSGPALAGPSETALLARAEAARLSSPVLAAPAGSALAHSLPLASPDQVRA